MADPTWVKKFWLGPIISLNTFPKLLCISHHLPKINTLRTLQFNSQSSPALSQLSKNSNFIFLFFTFQHLADFIPTPSINTNTPLNPKPSTNYPSLPGIPKIMHVLKSSLSPHIHDLYCWFSNKLFYSMSFSQCLFFLYWTKFWIQGRNFREKSVFKFLFSNKNQIVFHNN